MSEATDSNPTLQQVLASAAKRDERALLALTRRVAQQLEKQGAYAVKKDWSLLTRQATLDAAARWADTSSGTSPEKHVENVVRNHFWGAVLDLMTEGVAAAGDLFFPTVRRLLSHWDGSRRHEASWDDIAQETAHQLWERWRGGDELVLAEGALELARGSWTSIRFGNVDDHLFLEVASEDGVPQLITTGPTVNHLDPSDRNSLGETYGHRVGLGGSAGTADFRRIRVWRDFHYTDRGSHATSEPARLGPSELLGLGDNSPESRDGRNWGPISTGDVLGRPIWVVFPVSSARALGGDVRPLIPPEGP